MCEISLMEIVLENCEMVTIPKECIKSFSLNDNDDWVESGEIVLQNLDKLELCTYRDSNNTGLERLKQYNDIAQVTMYYKDGENKTLAIDWKDDERDIENNLNQSTKQVDDILYINFK